MKERVNVMDAVRTVRRVSNVPILVIRKQYDGMDVERQIIVSKDATIAAK